MGKNNVIIPQRMPLGKILQEAGLVSPPQIQVALLDQMQYDNLMLGEILALHGWLKQETADFFAARWDQLLKEKPQQPLGQYLKQAALLDEEQIKIILQEQKQTFMRFGKLAVMKGYIKQQTINFFLDYFFSEKVAESPVIINTSAPTVEVDESQLRKNKQLFITHQLEENSREDDQENHLEEPETYILEEYLDNNDIIWIV